MPIVVSSVRAIPKRQQRSRQAADRAFIPPADLSLDSQSIFEVKTLKRYVITPISSASIKRSNSSEDAPEGCCHVNIRMEDAASSIPKHRGAVSPLRVDGAVMLGSFDAKINGDSTWREWSSIIASAEQYVREPRTIPA